MAKYRFSSYLALYDVRIEDRRSLHSRSDVCFAKIFSELRYGIGDGYKYTYDIYTCYTTKLLEGGYDNYCPFNIDEVRAHIHRLKKLFPFTYHVSKTTVDVKTVRNIPVYKIHVEMFGKQLYHRYMLTWVRYLYEHPYNFYMREAYRLQKLKNYKFTSAANLFLVVGNLHGGGLGHACSLHGKLISNKQLKNRLNICKDLNSLYNNANYDYRLKPPFSEYIDETDAWTDDNFRRNLEVYQKSYIVLYDKKTFQSGK